MKKLLFFLCFSLKLAATDVIGVYLAYEEASLSSSSQKVTVQQISSGTRDLQFDTASLWCSVDTTFSLSRTGTAATATSHTPLNINSWQPTATSIFYTSSDVGTGTLIRKYDYKANSPDIVVDLSDVLILRNAGTTGNITFSTTSISGTCRISITYKEVQ